MIEKIMCLPERATISCAEKPRWPNDLMSSEALKVGNGKLIVSSILDLLPSFLPLGMSYTGPPACNNFIIIIITYKYDYLIRPHRKRKGNNE